MLCSNCGNNNVDVFGRETVPCGHCECDNTISYNVCQDCGAIWKSVNGQPIDGSMVEDPEMAEVIRSDVGAYDETLNTLKLKSMRELVHKCIRCGDTAYEVEPKLYRCSDCDFEWEII